MTPSPATPPRIPDYELLKAIGRGSYGEVWLARSVTGVFRIIKVVRRDNFEDERPYRRELEGISRFQAAASGRPRQLALLHVGRNDEAGYFYYVMEPADDAETGSEIDPERYTPLTLKELFARRGRLPATECVQLALELARGLAVLHTAGLIHRDIKPANIIFVQRVPKLADVGLVASSNTAMTYVGTEGFSPPEGPGTASGDLYGLGKVLYEIATGLDRLEFPRLPPDIADSPDALLLREINALVLRTCDPDPARRPASAEAFARDLELIQAGQSAAFYEALRRRLRLVAATAGIIALLAAAGAGLSFWRSSILAAANLKTLLALYKSDLAVAQLAYGNGELGRARAALDRQVPRGAGIDLRGIEFSLLAKAVQGHGQPLQQSTNPFAVRNLAADATGDWLAAGFGNDTAALWNLRTGTLVRHIQNVRVVGGFTPEGQLVIDEPSRALRFEDPSGGPVRRIETKRRLLQLSRATSHTVLISPRDNAVLQLIDPLTDRTIWSYDVTTNWVGYNLSHIAVSESGSELALMFYSEAGAARSRTIAAVSPLTGVQQWSFSTSNRVIWLRYSPSGEQICANTGGSTLITLNSRTGSILKRLVGHSARIQDAAYSPDGRHIATASADQNVKIWSAETGDCVRTFTGLGRPATSVNWAGGTNYVAAGSDMGDVRLFSLVTPPQKDAVTGLHADLHGDVAISSDGRILAVSRSTNSIAIFDSDSLTQRHIITNAFQPVTFLDGFRFLIAMRSDLSLIRVDLNNSEHKPIIEGPPRGFALASWSISPNSHSLAMTSRDGRIDLVDLTRGIRSSLRDPDGKAVWGVTYTPDSRQLWTGNEAGNIRKWNAETPQPISEVARVNGEIQAIAVSHNSKWAAVGIYGDSSIRILDCETAHWKATLTTHRRFVTALAFTKSDNRLISAGSDGRMVVWRVPEFEEIASFELPSAANPTGDEGISTLKIAEDEGCIGALTEDGRLQLWRAR